MGEWIATYWPVVTGFAILFLGLGETRQKVSDLRTWKAAEEARRDEQAKALEAIRLDIGIIKTILKIRAAEDTE